MAGQDDARLLARSAVYLWCSESSSSSAMNSAVSSLSSNPGDLTVRQMPSYYDYVCRGMQDLDKSNDSSSAEEGCSLPSSHPETEIEFTQGEDIAVLNAAGILENLSGKISGGRMRDAAVAIAATVAGTGDLPACSAYLETFQSVAAACKGSTEKFAAAFSFAGLVLNAMVETSSSGSLSPQTISQIESYTTTLFSAVASSYGIGTDQIIKSIASENANDPTEQTSANA